jgi:8-oxo-dGTP pyrophosphatase MutT (NUDIX family)
LQKINNTPGAGVILYKKFSDGHKILVLTTITGIKDIPKGHCDIRDINNFMTAQRECFEETQIFFTQSDLLTQEMYQDENLTIFCAITNQTPIILANPGTQKIEHSGFNWLSPLDAQAILPVYLEKAIKWSVKFYNDN